MFPVCFTWNTPSSDDFLPLGYPVFHVKHRSLNRPGKKKARGSWPLSYGPATPPPQLTSRRQAP
jgi:hypothetical protein